MGTRTIVTSQPDVACDVCGRRLLRGEQPDVFLAAGRRRIVCELCAPRATHEGWLRESEGQSVSLPPLSPRRGRSLFERLRQVGRPPGELAEEPASSSPEDGERQPYDFLEGYPRATADPVPAAAHGRSPVPASSAPAAGEASDGQLAATAGDGGFQGEAPAVEPASHLEHAVEVFNASEYPRRVAGVARSLGTPAVSVRSAEHLSSVVRVVVAWELCWYRYEVDLSEQEVEVRVLAQGTELAQLAREERVANATADGSGALALSVA